MTIDQFMDSLSIDTCSDDFSTYLQALWYDAKGNWHKAHEIVQEINDPQAARIHAYLHRKEGDELNAKYWHRRAASQWDESISLKQEWRMLLEDLLAVNH